jgi:hypothetical protein
LAQQQAMQEQLSLVAAEVAVPHVTPEIQMELINAPLAAQVVTAL